MKNIYIIITLTLIMSFLLMPLLAVDKPKSESDKGENLSSQKTETSNSEYLNKFNVYLSDEERVVSLSAEEYLTGVLAAEMSAEYHEEALKAQVLAAYTYAYRKHIQNTNADYDITTDSSLDQGYLSEQKRKEKWNEKYDEYNKKIKNAINEVKGMLIVYNNEPILAAYHSISAGNTETAKNVWGTDYAYLQSETSVGDLLAPEFLSEKTVSLEEFKEKITKLGCSPTGEAKNYIGKSNKSDAGTVLGITICSKELSGADIREAFSLRSAAFEITFSDDKFTFTVSGYGHGVGMSQFGANYMAQQGSSYTEIISAYYRGVSIVDLKVS